MRARQRQILKRQADAIRRRGKTRALKPEAIAKLESIDRRLRDDGRLSEPDKAFTRAIESEAA